MKPLVATAATQDEMAQKIADARARIAFYASTPAYAAAFEHLGLGDLVNRCRQLSKAKRWEELPQFISDEILDQFVVIGTHDAIAHKLCDQFGELVTNVEFSISVRSDKDRQTLARLAREIQSVDPSGARRAILG